MRKALLLLLVCVNLAVSAKDYYVSSTGNDSADGLSSSTAWKTISKVNSVSSLFNPGDKILFRRGDVFAGTLIMSKSGVAGNPITIGAYGSGANPVITGFITISDWDSYGGGIYYKSVSCESSPNIVTVNGVNTPIGRWPNSDYLTIDSHSSNRSITDSELPSSPNWTGAEVVIRKQPYIWDRNKITSHSGSTISYTSGSNYSAKDGYGYFIQNDIKTLDRQGEWYHNGTNFYMHFGSSSPENYSVKISVRDILINVDKVNYITIENISLEGANKYAVQVRDAGYITIQNCNINFTGNTAIYGPFWGSSPNCKIINNTISNSNNNAITLNSDHTNATISGNNIKNTGMIVGMGESGDGTYKGIYASGDNGIIQYNTVENTGYVGIDFFGNNTTVAYNFVNNFNLVKNDGGGIYTYTGTKTPRYGQKVTNNIILNGIGYGKGIPDNEVHASGIYTDDRSRSILIADNTIANCNSSGIFIHNAHEIDITGNTLYNNGSARLDYGSQILFVHDSYSPDDPIRNLKINNNVFFARTKAQSVICFMTMDSDIPRFGTADNNYFAKPIDNTYIARTWNAGWWSTATMRSLSNWQSFTGQDKNSRIAPISVDNENKIKFEYNATCSNKVISLDGSYIDVKGTKYSGSITLQPYSSVVLMVDPNPSAPPTVPVYVSSAIENTAPSKLEMTYNLSLANIVPPVSAFTVKVNSSTRSVSSVAVSGTKVVLTLSSPVAYGDNVTVAYTKPSSKPLQTTAGGQAATISAKAVTNRVAIANAPPVVVVTSPKTSYSGFVSEISAAGSYDTNKDNLTFSWTAQSTVPISSRSGPTIEFLAPIVSEPTTVQFTVKVSDGKVTQSKVIPVEILPYKPELEVAEVVNVEASSYHSPNYPHNVVDGNIGTMWAANGTGEYLIIELKEPFSVQHVKLAFQPGQKKESYFDLSGSNDMVKWEPILIKSVSCDFSGNLQVFDFPHAKAEREYRYIKLTGQGNLSDNWNYISELRIYGYRHRNPESYENLAVKVYPNPASEVVNIRIDESSLSIDFIRIVHLSGRTVYINNRLGEGTRLFNIPINLANGTYVIQMGKGNLTLFTQKLIVQN